MLTRVPYNVKAPESLFKKYTHRELELASLWFIFHKKYSHSTVIIFFFPVWLRNQLISAGIEPIFSHAEKIVVQTIFQE